MVGSADASPAIGDHCKHLFIGLYMHTGINLGLSLKDNEILYEDNVRVRVESSGEHVGTYNYVKN
jgi:hypothetical protein